MRAVWSVTTGFLKEYGGFEHTCHPHTLVTSLCPSIAVAGHRRVYLPHTRITNLCAPLSVPLQLTIESRVTSDDLQLAVSATDDKIVAVKSSVESALSDRFRRMQEVVHEQARF